MKADADPTDIVMTRPNEQADRRGVAERASVAPRCRTCRTPIHPEAKRCQSCQSWQDWRRFTGPLTLMGILPIVASILTAAYTLLTVPRIVKQLDEQAREVTVAAVVTGDDILLERSDLKVFVRRYLSSESDKPLLRIALPPIVESLEMPARLRLDEPSTPETEYRYVQDHLNGFHDQVFRFREDLNRVIAETARSATLGEQPSSELLVQPPPNSAENQLTILQGDEATEYLHQLTDGPVSGVALEDLLFVCIQRYAFISLRRAIDTVAKANRIKDLEVRGIVVPKFVLLSDRIRDIRRVYERSLSWGADPLAESDFVELELVAGPTQSTRVFLPKRELSPRTLAAYEERPIRLKETASHFSTTFWARHVIWQIATRQNVGLRRSDYEHWGIP